MLLPLQAQRRRLLHALRLHLLVLDLRLQQLDPGDPLAQLDPLDLPRLELPLLGLQGLPGQHVEGRARRCVGLDLLHQRQVATQEADQDAARLGPVVLGHVSRKPHDQLQSTL